MVGPPEENRRLGRIPFFNETNRGTPEVFYDDDGSRVSVAFSAQRHAPWRWLCIEPRPRIRNAGKIRCMPTTTSTPSTGGMAASTYNTICRAAIGNGLTSKPAAASFSEEDCLRLRYLNKANANGVNGTQTIQSVSSIGTQSLNDR